MKKMKILSIGAMAAFLFACSSAPQENSSASTTEQPKSMVQEPASYDPHRGEGKWSAENITLNDPLNEEWVKSGQNISSVKCESCHKMTDEKLVGPGWKGVTQRRKPEWVMNFITNPDPMLDKDPEAQAMLELCLVRMPNQSLSDAEARNILEFMFRNDGKK